MEQHWTWERIRREREARERAARDADPVYMVFSSRILDTTEIKWELALVTRNIIRALDTARMLAGFVVKTPVIADYRAVPRETSEYE